MSITVMKQALEALEKLWDIIDDIDTYGDMAKSDDKLYRSLVERRQRQRFEQTGISTDGYELNGGAITSLRQAIAEAEKQGPVRVTIKDFVKAVEGKEEMVGRPVYWAQWPNDDTRPQPKREWVGLTPADFDKLEQLFGNKVSNDFVFADIVCVISAKLKDKNGF